jgi:hypothetical protein
MFGETIPAKSGAFGPVEATVVSTGCEAGCQIAFLWTPGWVATRVRRMIDPTTRTIDFNLSFSMVLPESAVK